MPQRIGTRMTQLGSSLWKWNGALVGVLTLAVAVASTVKLQGAVAPDLIVLAAALVVLLGVAVYCSLPLWPEAFSSANLCVTTFNIAGYMVMQTFFFYFVGATQYDTTIRSKSSLIATYAKNASAETREELLGWRTRTLAELEVPAKEQRARRDAINRTLLMNAVAPYAGGLFGVSLACGAHAKYKRKLSPAHAMLLGLVVFAFTTEAVVFLYVIRPFEMYGDFEIADRLLQEKLSAECSMSVVEELRSYLTPPPA